MLSEVLDSLILRPVLFINKTLFLSFFVVLRQKNNIDALFTFSVNKESFIKQFFWLFLLYFVAFYHSIYYIKQIIKKHTLFTILINNAAMSKFL